MGVSVLTALDPEGLVAVGTGDGAGVPGRVPDGARVSGVRSGGRKWAGWRGKEKVPEADHPAEQDVAVLACEGTYRCSPHRLAPQQSQVKGRKSDWAHTRHRAPTVSMRSVASGGRGVDMGGREKKGKGEKPRGSSREFDPYVQNKGQ